MLFWRLSRTLFRALRRTTTLVVILAMLALNVATLTFAGLNALVSGAIATATGVQSVAKRQAGKAAALEADLATARATAGRQADELAAARRTISAQADELAAARKVTYRGRPSTVSRAVSDTTERVTRRTATAAGRNLAATGAEAIPVWGVGVIAAATAYELKVACDTMRDLHELDLAFDPEAALDPERMQACGAEVPTGPELWEMVRASPGALAEGAETLFAGIEAPEAPGWMSVLLGGAAPEEP